MDDDVTIRERSGVRRAHTRNRAPTVPGIFSWRLPRSAMAPTTDAVRCRFLESAFLFSSIPPCRVLNPEHTHHRSSEGSRTRRRN